MSVSRRDYENANKALVEGFIRLGTYPDAPEKLSNWQEGYLQAVTDLAAMYEVTYGNFNGDIWDKRLAVGIAAGLPVEVDGA